MYNAAMRKAWYIMGYTFKGGYLCRECVAETLNDDSYKDPYTIDEHPQFPPIFVSDELEDGAECDYCWKELD